MEPDNVRHAPGRGHGFPTDSDSPLLTIFSLPKPFLNDAVVPQNNAIGSWTRLGPRVEVVLFGDEPGIEEAAAAHGARWEPQVDRNDYGTPLVSDAFRRASLTGRGRILCYANADIMFVDDLVEVALRVFSSSERFLLAGQRWNLEVDSQIDFGPGWDSALRKRVGELGQAGGTLAIDYFVFPKGLFVELPPFAVGRPAWDNWMIRNARDRRIPVVDASGFITAIHQAHGYGHVPMGKKGSYEGPEADINRVLDNAAQRMAGLADATHRIRNGRVGRVPWHSRFRSGARLMLMRHPRLQTVYLRLRGVKRTTKP